MWCFSKNINQRLYRAMSRCHLFRNKLQIETTQLKSTMTIDCADWFLSENLLREQAIDTNR